MDTIFASGPVQVVSAIIMATALLQVLTLLFSAWRSAVFARDQQELALTLLQRRVDGRHQWNSKLIIEFLF